MWINNKSSEGYYVEDYGENIKTGGMGLGGAFQDENWATRAAYTDMFTQDAPSERTIYTLTDIEIANGCNYLADVEYCTVTKIGTGKGLFGKEFDENISESVLELYSLRVEDIKKGLQDTGNEKTLGTLVNAGSNDGYAERNPIKTNDPHYGWELGKFFVSGFTRATTDEDGTDVFLKNVGDKISLSFLLEQDITRLNGNEKLFIAEDNGGKDQYFQTQKMEFGSGTLILRYTDEKGIKHEPIIYNDILWAMASPNANTTIQLLEEGDYEVALDYKIGKSRINAFGNEVLPSESYYRIFFKFKIRNGNCMVFPFDLATGDELRNNDIAVDGFRLDLAKSKFLIVDITRTDIIVGKKGIIEDTRVNIPTRDGREYTDEGIYCFTVKNQYTGESTSKTIYVGDSKYYRAMSMNGIDLDDLNELIKNGAVINEDGSYEVD